VVDYLMTYLRINLKTEFEPSCLKTSKM